MTPLVSLVKTPRQQIFFVVNTELSENEIRHFGLQVPYVPYLERPAYKWMSIHKYIDKKSNRWCKFEYYDVLLKQEWKECIISCIRVCSKNTVTYDQIHY